VEEFGRGARLDVGEGVGREVVGASVRGKRRDMGDGGHLRGGVGAGAASMAGG
jgi:hypothetical protein